MQKDLRRKVLRIALRCVTEKIHKGGFVMNFKKLTAAFTALLCCASVGALMPTVSLPASAESTIANPFIWSDVPDDDIIRVGDTYYMVSTTMFFTPGVPIMKSKDLASWEICGYVYDTYADGNKQNLVGNEHDYAHGQWATSLRYKNGTYYVFFGSYGTGKSYIYKTKDIESGNWTRTELNGMYHDASMWLDDDGRNYLVYGGGGEIKIKEFNADMTGFKQGGVDQTIFKTGLDNLAGEGSHVQKIGDYYYVFVIAWPSGHGRLELCYRSKSITGPYEGKTILDSGLGTYGSGVAQGGIVDTPDGAWYGLMFQDHGSVGRIPVLVPVNWVDGWPMLGVNGKAPTTITVPGDYKGTFLAKDDEFNYSSNKLALEWQWNHNPDNKAWSVTEREGYLRLHNEHIAKSIMNARNTLTMRTEGPSCSSAIKLDTTGMKPGDHAGLSAFQFNYGNVGVRVDDSGKKYIYMAKNGVYGGNNAQVVDSYDKIIQEVPLSGDTAYLKVNFNFNTVDANFNVSNNIDKAEFFYSTDGSNWTKIGDTLGMTYDLKLFTGYRSAIYSYPTKSTGGYADIDYFDYERAEWNAPVVIEPDADGYYFHDTFEGSVNGWTGRGPASVSSTKDVAYEGSGALYTTDRTSSWNGAAKTLNNAFKAGESYSFSANVRFDSGSATDKFHLTLQYNDAAGEAHYDKVDTQTAAKGEWVQLSNTEFAIPAGAKNLVLYVETDDSTNNFTVDDVIGAPAGTVIPGAGKSTAHPVVAGDVNADGSIDVFDLSLAKRGVVSGFANASDEACADVDGSGKAEVKDLVLLTKYIHGQITSFANPTEQPSDPTPTENPATGYDNSKWDTYQETATPQMQAFYQSSIKHMGNTSRLTAKLAAAEAGEPLTVAYLGGSITEGKKYSSPFSNYLKETFAKGSFTEINAGMSGTSSVVGLVRSEKDIVAAKPDIIFIEFSVNDHEDILYKKSFESVIKKFLDLPNAPAVGIIINRSKGGFSSQSQMYPIGKNFDIPVISMDDALTGAFNSGLLQTGDYFSDEYHPHDKGGQLVADCLAYYVRQALKTENKSGAYVQPNSYVYGAEYASCTNVNPKDLTGFDAGSWVEERGYGSLPFGYKLGGGAPMKFKANAKGFIVVFKANSKDMGSIDVTVNGKTTKINGNKLYTWGGPDAELGYYQDVAGDLDVSISGSGNFTIWGIGMIQ